MTADLPPEAITAAAEAIRAEMKASREVEPDALARVALEAAGPHIVEHERQRADALALGGMEIEVAVAGTCRDLGIDYPARGRAGRPLRALYRRGVNVGFGIARKYAPPQAQLPAIEAAVAEAAAAERSRIAASLRTLPVLEFLARHGLRPGTGTARVLCAIAAEIEGPGAPGCGHHPGPPEVIPVRPKVSRRGTGQQEAGDG